MTTMAQTKLIHVYPHRILLEFKVELGGTFEFSNDSDDIDEFDITFEEPRPPGASKTTTGNKDKPIVIPMPNEASTFKGHIVFKKKDKSDPVPVPFIASSCVGCH